MKYYIGLETKQGEEEMVSWNNSLFQNPMAIDIRTEFEQQFLHNKTVSEITSNIIKKYDFVMNNPYKEPLLWYALVDVQRRVGTVTPMVQEKVLFWLSRKKSQIVLNDEEREVLYHKLLFPQPLGKKVRRRTVFQCTWEMGDVFSYQLDSDLAKEKGLYGRHFLIQKVDEGVWHPGHIVPIVYVKITADDKLPSDMDEFNELEFVQTWFTRYEERFWPIDGTRPEEDMAEKAKLDYKVDEFGFLPQYRIMLLNISESCIPQKLKYLGNFKSVNNPPLEFVPHSKDNITNISWKQFDDTFETKMIKRYYNHNRRELSIYSSSV